MWRAYTGVIHCVFDQIPNLQNCFIAPHKAQEGRGLRHLPPSPYWSIFKKSRHLGFGVLTDIWSMGYTTGHSRARSGQLGSSHILYCTSPHSVAFQSLSQSYSLLTVILSGQTFRYPDDLSEAESKKNLVYWSLCLCRSPCTNDIGQPYARDDFFPQLGTQDLASVQCTLVYSVHYSAGINL